MSQAGGSARREYERRRAKEATNRQANRTLRLVVTVLTPLLVYGAVRGAVPLVNNAWESWAQDTSPTERPVPELIRSSTANLAALVLAVAATLNVVVLFWGRRQSTEAWGKGATGEERTGRLLDRLPAAYVVRHDLSMPGSRANIDHVVVGPTGVFTVETKAYRGGVKITGGRVTVAGRRRDGIAAQAAKQAEAVAARIGRAVEPVVVVHGGVERGWFTSPVIDGVRFCAPKRLVEEIRAGKGRLSPEEVEDAVTRLHGLVREP